MLNSLDSMYRRARYFQHPDGEICYVQQGSGAPLVLLHGIPLSILTWRWNIDALSHKFNVIAPDLKGFGRSHKQAGDYTPQAHAAVIAALLRSLGAVRATVAGSSYACSVAAELAIAAPELVSKVVLINSIGVSGARHSMERLLRMRMMQRLLAPVLRSSRIGRALLASKLRASYVDPGRATPDLIDTYFSSLRERDAASAFLATLRSFDEKKAAQRLGSIMQNTLIIWGGRDRILPVAAARRLHAALLQSRLEILDDCGHLPHEDAPERVNGLIIEFAATKTSASVSPLEGPRVTLGVRSAR